jgi:putative phage-type endonuclease
MHEQGTAEWFAARIGKATGSKIADIVNRQKNGKRYAAYDDYLWEVVTERMTGTMADHVVTFAMQRGTDLEPEARSRYEVETGELVIETGFVEHPTIVGTGGSPDGLVGEDGLIEIKCPNPGTHVANLLRDGHDPKYFAQMQWNMECTGRQWCDFVSYDDRFEDELQICIYRVERDEEWLKDAREKVQEFLAEVAEGVKKLEELKEKRHG